MEQTQDISKGQDRADGNRAVMRRVSSRLFRSRQPKAGEYIRLVRLPRVWNDLDGAYERNAYEGFEGVVEPMADGVAFEISGATAGLVMCFGIKRGSCYEVLRFSRAA